MHIPITKLITVITVVLLAQSIYAGKYGFELKTNKPDAIYRKGEKITFSAMFLKNKKPAAGHKITYKLIGDGKFSRQGEFISNSKPYNIDVSLNYPAWIYAEFTAFGADGKPLKTVRRGKKVNLTGEIGAMVAPSEITVKQKAPADFDEFWRAKRAMLNKIPVKAKLTEIKVPEKYKGSKLFDVTVDCAGEAPVIGYLLKPAVYAPKSLPVIVMFNSAMVRSAKIPYQFAKDNVIAFSVNPYGIPNGKNKEFYQNLSRTSLRGYPQRNKNNRDKFYFHDMFLRVMRALDYAKTLPEWDGRNLIIIGGSMGGGQGIAGAALDKDVSLAIIDVPALCDFSGIFADPVRQPGWPRPSKALSSGPAKQTEVSAAVAYYDGVNFAGKIKCPVYVCTGFIDNVCVPTSVFAFYNNLPKNIEKAMTTNPYTGHYGTTRNTRGLARLEALLKSGK